MESDKHDELAEALMALYRCKSKEQLFRMLVLAEASRCDLDGAAAERKRILSQRVIPQEEKVRLKELEAELEFRTRRSESLLESESRRMWAEVMGVAKVVLGSHEPYSKAIMEAIRIKGYGSMAQLAYDAARRVIAQDRLDTTRRRLEQLLAKNSPSELEKVEMEAAGRLIDDLLQQLRPLDAGREYSEATAFLRRLDLERAAAMRHGEGE